jgi:hypothetical protein
MLDPDAGDDSSLKLPDALHFFDSLFLYRLGVLLWYHLVGLFFLQPIAAMASSRMM